MLTCPYCQAEISAWAVLSSGSLGPRTCPTCEKKYFSGGGAGTLGWFLSGLFVAFIVGWYSPQSTFTFAVCLLLGAFMSLWHTLHSPVAPLEARRRDLVHSAFVWAAFAVALVVAIALQR
jgi:hypothetical protein